MRNSNIKILALDLETTGLNSDKDKIIEVGWCLFDLDNEYEKFSSLIYYGGKLDKVIVELTGIREDELARAPAWEKISTSLEQAIQKADVVIGHNLQFDLQFLKKANFLIGDKIIWDSWHLAGMLIGKDRSFSLKALADFIAWEYQAHRALDDAVAVAALYRYLVKKKLREVSDLALERILSRSSDKWIYYNFFNQERDWRWRNNISVEKKFASEKIVPTKVPLKQEDNIDRVVIKTAELENTMQEWYGDDPANFLVLNKKVWEKSRRVFSLNFIDRQNNYLCKHQLKRWLNETEGDFKYEIYAKIILQIDRGSWDGYLYDISWSPEEWGVVNNLRCGNGEIDHDDCFWSHKTKVGVKQVLTDAIWKENSRESDKIYFWSDKLLPEDGLTDIFESRLNITEWLEIANNWDKCRKCLFDNLTKQNRTKREGFEQDLSMWLGMLGLLVRSKGSDRENERWMYLTPALFNDLSWQSMRAMSEKIVNTVSDLMDNNNQLCDEHKNWLKIVSKLAGVFSVPPDKSAVAVDLNKYNNQLRIFIQMVDLEEIIQNIFLSQKRITIAGSWSAKVGYLERGGLLNRQINLKCVNGSRKVLVNLCEDEMNWIKDSKTNLLVFGNRLKLKSWLKKYENNLRITSGLRDWYADSFFGTGLWAGTFYDLSEIIIKGWKFDQICLESLPFDPPDILVQTFRAMYYGDDNFRAYKIPRMLSKIAGAANLLNASGEIVTMDRRFFDKKYYNLLEKL